MKEIKCPSCGKTFAIDQSSFQEILGQIKNEEFNKQIQERLLLAEEDNKKRIEILKQELKIKLMEENRIKETKIQTLESKLNVVEEQKLNALNEIKNQSTNKINFLNNEINNLKKLQFDFLVFCELNHKCLLFFPQKLRVLTDKLPLVQIKYPNILQPFSLNLHNLHFHMSHN